MISKSRTLETNLNRKWELFALNLLTYLSRSFSTLSLLFSTLDRVLRSNHFHLKTNHLVGYALLYNRKFFHCSALHEILYRYLKHKLFGLFLSSFSIYLTMVKAILHFIRLESTYIIFPMCQENKGVVFIFNVYWKYV